jgi:SAM-dependent methyltransferase
MPPCRICATQASIRPLREHRAGDCTYALWLCPDCGLMFWHPSVLPDAGYYDDLDFGVYSLAHTIGHMGPLAHQTRFTRRPPRRNGTLLDIGCSDGAFIEWAQDAGFTAYGIDIDDKAITQARKRCNSVWSADLLSFSSLRVAKPERFDVITAFEVLEHQPDPGGFLSVVTDLLSKDGWIAGTVPNRSRLVKSGRTASEHYGDYPPHHFLWFDKQSLTAALRQFGFVDILVEDQMFGYAVEEALFQSGQKLKSLLLCEDGSRSVPLERLAEVGRKPGRGMLILLFALRFLKDAAKLPPKAIEAAIEAAFGRGASLYFEGRLPC